MSIRVEARVTSAVNEGAIAAAVAGLGVTVTSIWGCRAELQAGLLVQLLPDWKMEPIQVQAIVPARRAATPAARLFIEYLVAAMATESTGLNPPQDE